MSERYTVVMPDGARFGPADLEVLREWARAGRIGPDTTLVPETTRNEVSAGSVEGLFFGPGSIAPAPPVQRRKGRATLWLVLGALGLAGGCAVLMLGAILLPVLGNTKLAARRTAALYNVKQLSLGVLLYAADADDAFPPEMASARAMEPWIGRYVKDPSVFRSKNPAGGEILGDARLNAKSQAALTEAGRTIVLHDEKPWTDGKATVGLADGIARRLPFPDIAELMKPDPFAPGWKR